MEQCAVGKIFWEFIIYCVVYRGHMHSDFHICGLCFEQVPVSRETGFRDFRIVYAIDAGSFISAAYLYHDGQITAEYRDSDYGHVWSVDLNLCHIWNTVFHMDDEELF